MAYEYKVKGQKVVLSEDEDLVAVRYRESTPHSARARVASVAAVSPFQSRIEVPGEKFTVLRVQPSAQPRAMRFGAAIESINAAEEVVRTTPVFKMGDSRVLATDRIIVGLRDEALDPREVLSAFGGQVIEEIGQSEYLAELPEDSDPLAVASELAERDDVDYAEPDFVVLGKRMTSPPISLSRRVSDPDPFASDQYAIEITEAVKAWNSQIGSPSVTIAILDEGVDVVHEDLAAVITASYDAVDADLYQEPNPWDAHGTACAGLAAAIHHNGRGIMGIGGGCSLMAIRIAYSPRKGARWVSENSWIRRGIDWAWENGADVLSNSWGGGAPSNAIINAYERALTEGRGGKGCVLIAAAGNDSGPVSFPATLAFMLTVSASNEYDEFKTKQSQDGENWWGSNFGPEVDVAAPGVHNLTTDITAPGGYQGNSNYTDFNGTSSATPIVAGAAGLVLSANPNLTESQVRDLLRNTADKVGATPYVNGRNDQMGYGRLNVASAVEQVTGGPRTSMGTIRQAGSASAKTSAFYLEADDGLSYLLRSYHGFEALSWPILEEQSLSYFEPFMDQYVTVTFARRQDTPQGSVLWGASVS